jgi:hypothetical protein
MGPIVTVILNSFNQKDEEFLNEHLATVSNILETKPNFWQVKTRNRKEKARIGAPPNLRPFEIVINELVPDFEKSEMIFLKGIGINTPKSITISALENENTDHKILASLACSFAEMFTGIIYMHGAIIPHRGAIKNPTRLFPYCTYEEALEFANTIEGVNHVYNFTTNNNTKWFNQFVDAAYLSNWMAHTNFRMVK